MPKPSAERLPDYERPPVIEVVCGVQFGALHEFKATTFGLLWQRFRTEYPTCEQQPPLLKAIERISEAIPEQPPAEWLSIPPLPRMFFIHNDPCWLVQVQPDRFLHNWRRQSDTDVYPRFPEVFEKFWSAWQLFLDFCREERIGEPQVNQLEVTYINHIVQGEGWEGAETIGQVFPDITWRTQRSFLPSLESTAWKATFAMPGASGRLHVSVGQAFKRLDMKPVLLCELTARGIPSQRDENAIRNWFHLGREWIVRGFADLTHEKVQDDIWKRKRV